MAIATCVFTCSNWFSISRTSCFSIFSGSSALSTKSLRLARRRVVTRSMSAIAVVLSWHTAGSRSTWRVVGVAVWVRFHLLDVCHQVRHLHSTQRLKEGRDLGGYLRHFPG